MGSMQRRIGPNKVGYQGVQQPFSDGQKQIVKEQVVSRGSRKEQQQGAPYMFFYQAQMQYMIQPLDRETVYVEVLGGGIQVMIAISEQSIYGVQYSGWSTNSRYPQIGGLRSTAQMISYSVSQSQIIQTVVITIGSIEQMDVYRFKGEQMQAQQPMGLQFILSAVAETNRAPFDQPEAESELVSGFMTEHSSVSFAFFFLGEYANMQYQSYIVGIMFKQNILQQIMIQIWIRATQPRMRFDQQQMQGWKEVQPIVVGYIIQQPCQMKVYIW